MFTCSIKRYITPASMLFSIDFNCKSVTTETMQHECKEYMIGEEQAASENLPICNTGSHDKV